MSHKSSMIKSMVAVIFLFLFIGMIPCMASGQAFSSSDIRTDFDGDGKSDVSVYRPGNGGWYIIPSSPGGVPYGVGWGADPSDIPVPGNYDGDGETDIAVYRATTGTWFIIPSSTGVPYAIGWGADPSDIPVPGDYDGDGRTDIAVYRSSTGAWYIIPSSGNESYAVGWGGDATDIPVPGDYNGDGQTDIAVYRSGTGAWYVLPSTGAAAYAIGWGGGATDIPVPGDYDGDGKKDVTVYRDGLWFVYPSAGGIPYAMGWGIATDIPVPGDYDGDGITDLAVCRDGLWFIYPSGGGEQYAIGWGTASDIPLSTVLVLTNPAPLQFTLSMSTAGNGTVTKNPDKVTYNNGEVVELTATPASGWTFSGWSGDLAGSANPANITMDANKTVTATFVQIQRTLTVNVAGSGSVTKNPDKVTYNNGEVVELTATPETGWAFSGWSGDLTGSTNPANITMDANKTVTATFVQIQRTLTVNVVGSGTVTKNPDKVTYSDGEVVELTATPASGWAFSGWSGDLTGSTNPANITMDVDKTVTATFVQIQRTLTVNVVGSGTVAKNPDKVTYNNGEVVQLTATPETGWIFSGWSGDLTGSTNPANLTMDANKTVTATFGSTSLKGYWTLDEGGGSVAADSSGNGNTGTVIGATWTASGKVNGALSLDGANDWVQIPNSASIASVTNRMTVAAWVYPTDLSQDWSTVMQRSNASNTWFDWQVYARAGDAATPYRPVFRVDWNSDGSVSPDEEVQGNIILSANTWYFITCTYDGSALRFYIDGTLRGTTNYAGGTIPNGSRAIWIGGNEPWGEYFAGRIDEVRIFNSALTQAEIQALMGSTPPPPTPGAMCETFDTGYTLGQTIGVHADWFDAGAGPVVTGGNGLAGSVGLASANDIFTWTNRPFNWNSPDVAGVNFQMDFQTDASGDFDDDRIGWMTTSTSADSTNFFGVQLDTVNDGGIVTYWRDSSGTRVQTPIVDFTSITLPANTWFRFNAKITKLTSTSAKIDVSLVQLDASGNPTGTPYTGTLADTSAWPDGAPGSSYFTAATMWPAYKNYSGIQGAADNACFNEVAGRFAFVVTTDWHTSSAQAAVEANLQQIKTWIDNPTTDMPAPKFMVITGDFPNVSQSQTSINNVLGSGFPWYPVIGNHEIDDGISNFNSIRDTMVPSLPYIVNYGPAGSTNTTYSWDYGNAHFVALNGYWNGSTSAGADSARDGDIVPELRNWIETDLAASTQIHRFVFVHEPAFPATRHVGDSLDQYPANRDAFIAALNNHNVQTLFTGHTHYYEHDVAPEYPLGNLHQITNGTLQDANGSATITYVLVDGPTATYRVYTKESGSFVLRPENTWIRGTTPTCYTLTLGHTGNGSDPVASPANSTGCSAGQYTAGATIQLSGALPAGGYYIGSWTGTSNDSSQFAANSVSMPAGDHYAGVNYTTVPPICYVLILGHTGEGSDPVAAPANSTGCSAGSYLSGEAIQLSGASPDAGWYIGSWTGTGNDSSTAVTNSLTMPANDHSAGVNYVETPPSALVCETFNGFTPGSNIGSYPGWYDGGSGPVVTAGNGVAGSNGLGTGSAIFNWTANPFNWNAADFQSVIFQGDFQTDGSGQFDDDRLSWTINGTSTSSDYQFGVQLDHPNGGIVTYWRNSSGTRIQTPIVPLGALSANTWYRFTAEITKLTATSAQIGVNLVQLDASGNPTGTPYTGTVADTSTWPGGAPAASYFTATTMWPSYKNFNALTGAADNVCYEVVGGTVPPFTTVTFQDGLNGYTGTVDTHIMESEPSTGHGTLDSLNWDTDDPSGQGLYNYALIRFDNIFGSGVGQIPSGAIIQSATLNYVVWNTGNPANVNEVAVDWTDAATWNDFGGDAGVQADEYGTARGTAGGAATGVQSVDVTASLAAWVNNPSANRGWIFRPTGTDGIDLRSSEYATVAQRPSLTVQYTTGTPGQYSLTVNVTGNGNVTLNPAGGVYDPGTVVQITAAPEANWTFSGWSGDLTGSANPTTITMNSNRTVTATFTLNQQPTDFVCETFESGFTIGQVVGAHADWYDGGSGPVVTSGNGVASSVGLAASGTIFTWTAHPFNWNAADFEGITLQMDFRTGTNGQFDDDRIGWMTVNNDTNSNYIFGVQLDHPDGGIVTYWRNSAGTRVQTPIVTLPTLPANTWYRFTAWITKLAATSARIDVNLVQLDASGNPTGAPYTGTVTDTSAWAAGAPATDYFTAASMWPAYKNHTTAAGPADNACFEISNNIVFAAFGDYGDGGANEGLVANLVNSFGPDFIVTTGDNSYGSNPLDTNIGQFFSSYIGNYQGTYGSGSATNRFFPALGNHDITDGGGLTAYLNYFTLPGAGIPGTNTSGNERYYDFVRGPVHFFVINSDPSEANGRTSTSTQAQWLQAQLAASASPWKIVYMHHPPFSSGSVHGSETVMQWPYEAWGASVVLAGHDHVYERILRDDNADGIQFPYLTTGAGGHSLYGFNAPVAGSQVRCGSGGASNGTVSNCYGSLIIEATSTSLTFEYWSVQGGGTLVDSYTIVPPPTQYALTVNTSGSGSVTLDPDGGTYTAGTVVELTAVPAANWNFTGWSGDYTGSTNPGSITMDADKTVTATFAINTYTLTYAAGANGSISGESPQTVNHGANGTAVTALPATGYHFVQWSDGSTANPRTDTNVTANISVNAIFAINTYTLTVTPVGSGSVAKNPDNAAYNHGDVVQLTANPAAGWAFSGWSGDLAGSTNPAQITMDGNKAVTAVFIESQYTLGVSASPVSGGSVGQDPGPPYPHGTVVTLTAIPAQGYGFTNWSGDLSGSDNPAQITMDGNKSVTANFTPLQYTLDINVTGNGSVTKNPDAPTYTYGQVVQLTATADSGWGFSGWSGDLGGTDNPASITMDGDKTVTATFSLAELSYALSFDGSNDYVTFGNSATLGLATFTIETWFKRTGTGVVTSTGSGGITNAIPLVTKGRGEADGTNADMNYFLGINATSGVLVADFEECASSQTGCPAGGTAGLNHPVSGVTPVSNNIWYHAAVTYDGTTWRLYLNGQLDRELVVGNRLPRWDSVQHAGLATAMTSAGATQGFFAGILDEVRIWNVVRSQAEIQAAMYQGITSGPGLLARWGLNDGSGTTAGNSVAGGVNGTLTNGPVWVTDVFPPPPTPPVAPTSLTATETIGTQINLGWADNSDNETSFEIERSTTGSGGPFSLLTTVGANSTTFSDSGLNSNSEYCYQVRSKNIAGNSGYSNVACASTPVNPNNAIDLGTGSAYVTFGSNSALGLAQFTIETWFKREGTGATTTTGTGGVTAIPLVTKGKSESDNSNVDMNYFLGIRSSDNILVADFEEGAGGTTPGLNHPVIGVTPIVNNTWYHAAVTYDGSKWQLFLNGILETELLIGQPPRSDSIQHAGLGTAMNSTGAAEGHFDGVLDEVRIWNFARTQTQIQSTINSQITTPQTGLVARWGLNETTGTVVNGSAGTTVNGAITNTGYSWVAGAPFNITINNPPNEPALVQPSDGATGVSASPTLEVTVSDPDSATLNVAFYGRQAAGTGEDFTIVVLPDTQFYSESYPATFTAQTQWIVNNAAAMNLAFVTHLGDVVNVYNNTTQWGNAVAAMDDLEAPLPGYPSGIPYGIAIGNHDNNYGGDSSYYNTNFGVSRFNGRSYYGGHYGSNNDNHYGLFTGGGLDFIIIHLAYSDSSLSAILDWADGLLKTYSSRRAIVVYHDTVLTGNPASFSTQGQAIYEALKDNPNLFLMLGGHTAGEGRRSDTFNGSTVHSLLSDYQSRSSGGSGWLRTMEFSPANNEIRIKTYSPTLDQWETDADSQFTLAYDMGGAGAYVNLGTVSGVASGGNASISWPGLGSGTPYEWFVEVSDGTLTTASEAWSFTTVGVAPTCYALTLGHTGEGSNPVASPTNSAGCSASRYVAGEAINLSGAVPTSGYEIGSWYGTGDDTSTASTNSLIMPANDHAAGVDYAALPAPTGWTAYNDCVYRASDQYIGANVTTFGIGSGFTGSTSGILLDQFTGTPTGVTATLTQSGGVVWQPEPASGGDDTAVGTDAYNTFHGFADMTGVVYYGSAGWYVNLTFTGLDPAKTYTFATSSSRGNATYTARISRYTVSGVDAATNASTSGVTVIDNLSLAFNTGDNQAQGYVARWTAIQPGADGSFTVRAEAHTSEYRAYAFDVFMLQEE